MSLFVDITKRFKGFTLRVRFETNGEPLGILGASGSGKSMTLKCIAGIETPDEGRILLNGRTLFDSAQRINLKPQQRRIGYLFQNYALFPHMTVEENISCALSGSKAAKKQAVEALLDRYALAGLENRYPGQLSGGQQQRVALARILAYQPEALLLDEPFSALDTHLKEALQIEMLHLLDGYAGDAVMVTHSRDEVYKLSKSLLILDDGQAADMGPTQEMFARPKTLVTARLTGCKNISAARPAGQNTVDALDWGCRLVVEGPVPETLTHVGVRAHYFHPASAGAQNAFPVRVIESVESPFEWNILFQNTENPNPFPIWWKCAKEIMPPTPPDHLMVAPSDILLLQKDGG